MVARLRAWCSTHDMVTTPCGEDRWSEANTEYFLTFCTAGRQPGLETPGLLGAIKGALQQMDCEALWRAKVGVVMPDHLHLLVEIGEAMNLSAAVRLFKGRLSPVLRKAGLRWQAAFFDHRMRPGEDRWPVFQHVFLNAYRANLVPAGEPWPGFLCAEEDWAWFGPMTKDERPYPEWLVPEGKKSERRP